jgi:pimeloyl-ACP methyl ester carboxylesterase
MKRSLPAALLLLIRAWAQPATTEHMETIDGVQIHYETRGAGEPVILLHGASGSSQDWLASISDLENNFQLIIPDMRGHGRSTNPSPVFRHDEASRDIIGLLDRLGIQAFKGIGVSAGGNVLLHIATKYPDRVRAMVIVSATPYFPEQARAIMRQYPASITEKDREVLRGRHPGGDAHVNAVISYGRAFADSYDDMNFTPPYLATIKARTLIVQGDRDPLYPVELSVEMARAIPKSSLWIIPNAGHGPVLGERWADFLKSAITFLRD